MKPDSQTLTRALQRCIERGLVSLGDPVEQHWPECQSLGITVRELVDGADGDQRDEFVAELIRRIDGRDAERFVAEERP